MSLSLEERHWLIRIEEKIDVVQKDVSGLRASGCVQAPRHDDHEKRIRTIESWVFRGMGGLVVITFLLHAIWK